MTRDELVTFVSTSTGYGEPDDIVACQKFLVARDRMIYDSALWKSSLVMCEISVDPVNNLDHAEGIIFVPEIITRPVAVRSTENALRVTDLGQYFRIDLDQFARTGTPYEFALLNPGFGTLRSYTSFSGQPVNVFFALFTDVTGVATPVRIVWRDNFGERHVSDVTAQPFSAGVTGATNLYVTDATRYDIEAVFKPADSGQLSLLWYDDYYVSSYNGTSLPNLASSASRSPNYQRLRLMTKPTVATTLRVLGKSRYESLNFATQEPFLPNSENVLLAFTRGDMLRRGGENGAANLAFAEGTALLDQLKSIEAVQAANNTRIIPDSGYGPDVDFCGNGLNF